MSRLFFGPGFRHVSGSDLVESGADGFADVLRHLEDDPALLQHVKLQGEPAIAALEAPLSSLAEESTQGSIESHEVT